MSVLNGFEERPLWSVYPPQDRDEFEALCGLVRGWQPARVLEVGSRHGRSLVRLGEAALPALEFLAAVDLPEAGWGARGSAAVLEEMAEAWRDRGLPDLSLFFADSQGPEMASRALMWTEFFDFVFIDGDHRYEGVVADFERYWPCVRPGGRMAFHDIAGDEKRKRNGLRLGVPQFWRELVEEHPEWSVRELCHPGSGFGIGVIEKEVPQ